MKTLSNLKQQITTAISLAYIILFTYAAVSKVLDFHNFQIQLGQSPLLNAFAGWVSYGVIIVELVLVLMLFTNKYKLAGLYGSFFLMTLFSAYIYIVLNHSAFTPCSCGGVLEKMSWTQHLIFNLVFVTLAGIAILLQSKTNFAYGYLTILLCSGAGTVITLHLLSEDITAHRNNFIRRMPDQVHKVNDLDLKFNSYYFAGTVNNQIYLGNVTAPLKLTSIDTSFKTKKEINIELNKQNLPFRAIQIQVQPNYFFVYDGTIPAIFRGKTGNWNANLIYSNGLTFTNPVFTDSVSLSYKTRKSNGQGILGRTIVSPKIKTITNSTLLQKQIDGIFDIDGNLLFDNQTNKLLYLYYYRNQFIIAQPNLKPIHHGKTIDTISKAQIQVAYNQAKNERKLSAPPLMVNKYGFAHKGLLFVQSALIGKFEDAKMWEQASVIDVYNYQNNSYIASFYVYNIDSKKLRRFWVNDNTFYGLVGTHLVSYRLSQMITNQYTPPTKQQVLVSGN